MEVYSTEQEQIEALKKWWRDNSAAIIAGVVLGLGGLFGFQAWGKYQNAQAENASDIYNQVVVALEQGNYEVVSKSVDDMLAGYSGTPYADLAALADAKAAVINKDYAAAKSRLSWVIEEGEQGELVYTAKLRLVRVHLAVAELEQAGGLLNESFPAGYEATVYELRGDLNLAKGDLKGAREAYDKALAAEVSPGNRQMIEIKRDATEMADETPADA